MMEHVRVVFASHPRWDGVVAPLALDLAPTPAPLRDAPLLAWSRLVEHCLDRSVDLLLLAGDFLQEPAPPLSQTHAARFTPDATGQVPGHAAGRTTGDLDREAGDPVPGPHDRAQAPLSDRLRLALFTGLRRLAQGSTQVVWLPSPTTAHFLNQLPGLPWPALHTPPTSSHNSLLVEYHAPTRALRLSPHAPPASHANPTADHAGQFLHLQLTGLPADTSPTPHSTHLDWFVSADPVRPSRISLSPGSASPSPAIPGSYDAPSTSRAALDSPPHHSLGSLVSLTPQDALPAGLVEVDLPLNSLKPASPATAAASFDSPAQPVTWRTESLSPLHWQTVTVDASDLATEADLLTACELALPHPPTGQPRHLTLLRWQVTLGPDSLPLATRPEVADRLLAALRDLTPRTTDPLAAGTLLSASLEWLPAHAHTLGDFARDFSERLARVTSSHAPHTSTPFSPATPSQPTAAQIAWARLHGLAWLSHAREDAA